MAHARPPHAIVGRARRFGFALALAGAGFALAGRRWPETSALKWIALALIVVAVTLLLAAITHRMLFQKLELLDEDAPRDDRG